MSTPRSPSYRTLDRAEQARLLQALPTPWFQALRAVTSIVRNAMEETSSAPVTKKSTEREERVEPPRREELTPKPNREELRKDYEEKLRSIREKTGKLPKPATQTKPEIEPECLRDLVLGLTGLEHFQGLREKLADPMLLGPFLTRLSRLTGLDISVEAFRGKSFLEGLVDLSESDLRNLYRAFEIAKESCLMSRFDFDAIDPQKPSLLPQSADYVLWRVKDLEKKIRETVENIKSERGVCQFFDDLLFSHIGTSFGIHSYLNEQSGRFFRKELERHEIDIVLADLIVLYLAYKNKIVQRVEPAEIYHSDLADHASIYYYENEEGRVIIKKDDGIIARKQPS